MGNQLVVLGFIQVWQAGSVAKHLTGSDLFPGVPLQAELRQVAGDRLIKIQPASFNELHHGTGYKAFGNGGQAKERVRCDGLACVQALHAHAFGVGDGAILDDAHRQAGDVPAGLDALQH